MNSFSMVSSNPRGPEVSGAACVLGHGSNIVDLVGVDLLGLVEFLDDQLEGYADWVVSMDDFPGENLAFQSTTSIRRDALV